MSDFATKMFSGQQPTAEDWNAYLLDAHRVAPGMTPNAFASARTPAGENSYDALASMLVRLPSSADGRVRVQVLDLACGDGYLIERCLDKVPRQAQITGIDMSDGELAAARERLREKNVRLVRGKAQQLPLADGSIDLILCHMAFMLMLPLEPVVVEIARVLKSGGLFAAIIGRQETNDGLLQAIRGGIRQFFAHEFPGIQPRWPAFDTRVDSRDGLAELFSPPLGFRSAVDIDDFDFTVRRSVEDMWGIWKDMYHVSALDADRRRKLAEQLDRLFAEHADTDGAVQLDFPMRRIIVCRV